MELTIEREQQLLAQIPEDISAFEPIYNHFYPKIFTFVYRRTFDYEKACDITAQTFFKVLEKIDTYSFQGYSIGSWIYKIASNEVKKSYRRATIWKMVSLEKVEFCLSDMEGADDEIKAAEDLLIDQGEAKELHKALGNLKEHYHQALVLRYWEKLPLVEIARILDKSESAIKGILHRGLIKLKAQLEA
jgi:RNA polymerase sigma-70 factor (ECF subfamily)